MSHIVVNFWGLHIYSRVENVPSLNTIKPLRFSRDLSKVSYLTQNTFLVSQQNFLHTHTNKHIYEMYFYFPIYVYIYRKFLRIIILTTLYKVHYNILFEIFRPVYTF